MCKVSICIPVYNAEKYIENTINMVLQQDYDDCEILISDNCSTDNSAMVISKFTNKKIKVFNQNQNIGMGGNWNFLLKQAKGKYVMIVCADDKILDHSITRKAQILDSYHNVDLVFSSSYLSIYDKKVILRRPYHKSQILNGNELCEKLFLTKNFIGEPSNVMLRKAAIDRIGLFSENLWYNIDIEYWIRILKDSYAFYIDEPMSVFCIRSTSATGKDLLNESKIINDYSNFYNNIINNDILNVSEKMIKKSKNYAKRRLFLKKIFLYLVYLTSKFRKNIV